MKVIKRLTVETTQVREILLLVDADAPNCKIETNVEVIISRDSNKWFEVKNLPVTVTVNSEVPYALNTVPKHLDVWAFPTEEEAEYRDDDGLKEIYAEDLRHAMKENWEEEKCKQEQ